MLQLRPAEPQDAAGVAGVHVRSWQVGYRGLLPDDYLGALRPEDRMARYTFGSADPDAPLTIVAVEGGAIRGFVTIGPSPSATAADAGSDGGAAPGETGEVFALYVDPESWGGGVGRRLMAEARTLLGGRGFSEAVLWVLVGNERAKHFYRLDGWNPDGRERRDEVWGAVVDELCLRRQLP